MEKQNFVLKYRIDWIDGKDSYGIVDYECNSISYPFENMSEKIIELEQGNNEEHTAEMIKEITIHIYERRLDKNIPNTN